MAELITIGTRLINIDKITHVEVGYITVLSKGEKKKKAKEAKVYFGKDSITFKDAEAGELLKVLHLKVDANRFKALD